MQRGAPTNDSAITPANNNEIGRVPYGSALDCSFATFVKTTAAGCSEGVISNDLSASLL